MYPVEILVLVLAQQPDVGELGQAAQLVDLVIDLNDLLLVFLPLLVDLYLFVYDLLTLHLELIDPVSTVLFLLLLEQFGRGLLPLEHSFLIFLELPQPILHVLLLLEQLILDLVVVPEEVHLVVDEGLEGVGFEAHVDQEDKVVHQLAVIVRRMEEPLLQLGSDRHLKGLQFADDELVGVVLLQRDIEEDELVPGRME